MPVSTDRAGSYKTAYANKISSHTAIFLQEISGRNTEDILQDPSLQERYPILHKNGILYTQAFIKLQAGRQMPEWESWGIHINTQTGNYLTADIPVRQITALAECQDIDYIHVGERAYILMDSARNKTHVNEVYNGLSLPQAYRGKDVIVGIIDIGFDYTHPNFYDTAGQALRIKRVWDQNNSGTAPNGYNYGREFTTDSAMLAAKYSHYSESHGSHVAGIAAGSGCKDTTPYRGVAPMSDIVMVGTNMYTTGIFDGICYIRNYAQTVGKPCVINMSIGSHVGPHDGTSVFDQYCDALLQTPSTYACILVGAAGNEGDDSLHLSINVATTVCSFLDYGNIGSKGSGYIDIWGDTNASYSVMLCVYNKNTATIVDSTLWITPSSTSASWRYALYDNDTINPDSAVITISSEIDAYNHKPHVEMYVNNSKQDDSIQLLMLKIISNNASTIHAWTNKGSFVDKGLGAPFVAGNTDYTTGEVGGSGNSILTVGAYTSKRSWTTINNKSYYYPNATVNDIASFSSHGPTVDGRHKPDITAPGQTLVSSVNHFHSSYQASSSYVVKAISDNTTTWYYATMQGTSMATPATTGIIALWLEAYPYLTLDQIKVILQHTAVKDSYYTNADIWGRGKIDAYAGLQFLLQQIEKPAITASDTVRCEGDTITLATRTGYASYQWSTGDTTSYISVTNTGLYAVRVVTSDGFVSQWSDTIAVYFTSAPLTPTIARQDSTLTSSANNGNQWYYNNNPINGATGKAYTATQPGTYGVVVTNNTGCSSAMASIVVDSSVFAPQKPTISPIGNVYTCPGDSVTLTAPSGYNYYLWTTGQTTQQIMVSDTGDYAVKVANKTGYYSSWSDSIRLHNYAQPATPVITANKNILTSSANSGNQWYYNRQAISGATSQTYTAAAPGLYGVMVTNSHGCVSAMAEITLDSSAFVPDKPNVSPNGDLYVCHGDSVTLTAPSGYNYYMWTTGQTTQQIKVSDTGDYAVKVADKTGYYSPWSDNVSLHNYAQPATPVITANKNILTSSESTGNQWYYNRQAISGATSQTYTATDPGLYGVMVSNSHGCVSAMAEITLDSSAFIPDKPVVSPNGDLYVCPGDFVTLTAPAGYDAYVWSSGQTTPSITVSDTGAYQVRVMRGGYYSPWSDAVQVYHYAKPARPVISADKAVLSSNYADGNQWYYEHAIIAGATEQTYTANRTGWYELLVTNQQGCTSDSAEIFVDVTIGIDETSLTGIKIYPNPAQDMIQIEGEAIEPSTRLQVYDMVGRMVNTMETHYQNHRITLYPHLSNGVYILKIMAGDKEYAYRIVIAK